MQISDNEVLHVDNDGCLLRFLISEVIEITKPVNTEYWKNTFFARINHSSSGNIVEYTLKFESNNEMEENLQMLRDAVEKDFESKSKKTTDKHVKGDNMMIAKTKKPK